MSFISTALSPCGWSSYIWSLCGSTLLAPRKTKKDESRAKMTQECKDTKYSSSLLTQGQTWVNWDWVCPTAPCKPLVISDPWVMCSQTLCRLDLHVPFVKLYNFTAASNITFKDLKFEQRTKGHPRGMFLSSVLYSSEIKLGIFSGSTKEAKIYFYTQVHFKY